MELVPQVRRLDGNLHLPIYGERSPHRVQVPSASLRAVFLDRDGVLVEDVDFLRDSSEMRILPGVPEAIQLLQGEFRIIAVTNQSGIARGLINEEGLFDIHVELVQRLFAQGAYVDGLYYCPHLPEATVPTYALDCECRKPRPGMLFRAASDWGVDLARSYMVGDTARDIEAAHSAGVRAVMIAQKPSTPPEPCMVARDLAEAARLIVGDIQTSDDSPEAEAVGFVNPALYRPSVGGGP